MKSTASIFTLLFLAMAAPFVSKSEIATDKLWIDFYGDTIQIHVAPFTNELFDTTISDSSAGSFIAELSNNQYQPITSALLNYKETHQLDDWLYYQLIRATAERLSPKATNYQRYTLYKWFLLNESGYGTAIKISQGKILLYVQSDDEVFNIPCITKNGQQYVCLNYHDYKNINFNEEKFTALNIPPAHETKSFSYKVQRLPDFKARTNTSKELQFDYYQTEYHFSVVLNKQVQSIFKNYPVVDYETYFNIPLSKATYNSLIPILKENVRKMTQKNGIDYLMRFTRYAFGYETDTKNFGSEKRLSPEQTLLYDNSDCEDRAGLFFYLVKEIYNLPMIVLSYPEHITIAVKLDKGPGKPIVYEGNNYWVCEPTPQQQDLRIGESLPKLRKVSYDIVYAYKPPLAF